MVLGKPLFQVPASRNFAKEINLEVVNFFGHVALVESLEHLVVLL